MHHCHVPEERAWLFESEDTQTTEYEYLNLLYSLISCLKPISVLETGAFKGYGTAMIAKALQKNGMGKVTSLEFQPKAAAWAKELIRINKVEDWAEIVEGDSLEFLRRTKQKYDFAFLDTQLYMRCDELSICISRGILRSGAMFAIHDTSRLRTTSPGKPDPHTAEHWKRFESMTGFSFVQFPYSRGLTLGQVL